MSTELLKIIATELRHELPGRGVDDYLEAASVVLDTIEEYNAASSPTITQRQAREKLAAIKRAAQADNDYYNLSSEKRFFDLMEEAGLELPL